MIRCTFSDVDKQVAYVGTEPVSLADAKTHLRVDFTDDDTLISSMITAAREAIEAYCRISIVQKTITLTIQAEEELQSIFAQPFQVREQFNRFELPYGPVLIDPVVTCIDSDGPTVLSLIENSDYLLSGSHFKTIAIASNFTNNILVYGVGYQTVPAALKLAIMNELSYRYEARGDAQNIRATAFTEQGVCVAARILANPYRRMNVV